MEVLARDLKALGLYAARSLSYKGVEYELVEHQLTPEQIRNLKNAYRVLYRSDLKLADAVAELKTRAATQPELRIFVDFIGESTRSLVR